MRLYFDKSGWGQMPSESTLSMETKQYITKTTYQDEKQHGSRGIAQGLPTGTNHFVASNRGKADRLSNNQFIQEQGHGDQNGTDQIGKQGGGSTIAGNYIGKTPNVSNTCYVRVGLLFGIDQKWRSISWCKTSALMTLHHGNKVAFVSFSSRTIVARLPN